MLRHATLITMLLLTGCVPVVEVSMKTRIQEDGTAIRETRFKKVRRSANNDQEKAWNKRPLVEDLGRKLGAGFATFERSDDEIRLYGVFADPNRIPADFRRDVPVLDGEAHNAVHFITEDLLFATRFVYRERFVDAIAPDDQKEARDTLVRFCLDFARAGARLELGQRYDLTALDAWLDETLRPTLLRLIDVYWSERHQFAEADPISGETGLDRVVDQALLALNKIGLLIERDGSDAHNFAIVRTFLTRLLAASATPKDQSAGQPKPRDFEYLFPAEEDDIGLGALCERVAVAEFTSTEAANTAFQRALLGVTGTFGSPPAEAEFHFDCAVEMPGMLLRTNGFLDAGTAGNTNGAFYLFDGDDLYPHGFELELESVVVRTDRLAAIRELKPSLDRRDAVALIAAVKEIGAADRAALTRLITQCVTQGSLAALPAPAAGDEDAAAAEQRRLTKLLAGILEVVRRD